MLKVAQRLDLRRDQRLEVNRKLLLLRADGSLLSMCTMWDVSCSGAGLRYERPLPLPDTIVLAPNSMVQVAALVRWRGTLSCGVEFLERLPEDHPLLQT
ncbi:PilZ domain-containing protein [Mangrovibrevibacter kandeliae]|uniref:PilZ domain-containing protein n=1 Tax=Mangrovibrevibacter kandeliae TaxID=2968473 RepID=UPI00211815A7|nr:MULTISPECIES: PilZ domain-containing protein [unclassified Aurantimonas]MCQ8784042.1 PilZ domain-containing protein [Aurantimonas sp. CSK15Z-1]MCW4116759.1 PilZ domain-containing protein [Aurantimonas sp. MSK8Z-1]